MAKRVYFAFHYQDVIDFRANVVRNHNALTDAQKAGYFDASIWETAKKTSDLALKRMINSELTGTSVTVVLVGSQTYERRWLRYEIIKSVEKGNVMLGVHINGIKGKDGQTKVYGPNPFDYLGLSISHDGQTASPFEWNGASWVQYADLGNFRIPQVAVAERGKFLQLSHWFPVNDWIAHNGFLNFATWIGS
jgi:hypothetical protein